MSWNEISSTVRMLSLLGRIRPEMFDVFPPHSHRAHLAGRFDAVALNPQPLPPRWMLAASELSGYIAEAVLEADLRGEDQPGWVTEVLDDWCGTGWPRRLPIPLPGPRGEGPQPEPWDVAAAQITGAVAFASLAARLAGGHAQASFAKMAESLAEASSREM
ncbi:hypothetical protein J2X85_002073 [Microbacterium trichothecenolyticum]|uniref:hypothetical protein n=1 Tax=Microbacterium trichothecenolyticum TaxID=69370 RepID=UPI00285A21B4|nr:hypothetical protein [Microbacterium trichothecenolyticum]MDR7185039.1 hypothetical protein [Microbacterium trichothecenolyticum]